MMIFYTYSSFSLTYSHTYCNINYIKILFCSCLGLLPTNGPNNVTNSSCFNCCVPKLLILMTLNHRNVSVEIVALIRKPNNDALSNCYAFFKEV
jgi:hypothetical protein